MTLLVVAAWEPELERFRALTSDTSPRIALDAVGIGLVDAAAGMTRSIAQHNPSQVLLLGTCGAAPASNLTIGEVVLVGAARLFDLAAVEGRAAMPFGEQAIVLAGPILDAGAIDGARVVTAACPVGITTCDTLASKLLGLADVEHLEAYSVARACALAKVPCAIVLGIANIVGARGREEWRTHHVEASARAAEAAYRWIRTSTTPRSPA